MKPAATLRIALAVAMLAAAVAGLTFLPLQQYLTGFLEWIQGMGVWGPVLFVLLYVMVCLLLLPGSVLTLAAGFMFGVVWGTAVASLGATLGATAAFLVGRFMVRGWMEHRLVAHPGFLAIDRAIDRQGFKVVFWIRLSSLFPYDLVSYLFGLTKISLGRYVLATWLGRLPETLFCAYLGSAAKSLADLAAGKVETGIGKQLLWGVDLFAMIVVMVLVARIAKAALRDAGGSPDDGGQF
jgi:uncharacterized membrane protein YdjX (TVP38/TMEM64 family)